jgi:hypothetical protein
MIFYPGLNVLMSWLKLLEIDGRSLNDLICYTIFLSYV